MNDNGRMKLRLSFTLSVLLMFNLSLVAFSAFLAIRSTQQFPMAGQLIDAGDSQLHVLDSQATVTDNRSTEDSATDDSAAASSPTTTIVLIHGASTSLLDFEHAIKPYLAPDMRVISVDRPGHGYSPRGDASGDDKSAWVNPRQQARYIAAALKQIQVDDAIWVGHSWAGSVVLAALLDETIPAKAGVLIAGATHPWEGESAWHVKLAATPVIGKVFSWQYIQPLGRLALEDAVAGVFNPEEVPGNYLDNTGLVLSLRPETYQHNAQDLTRLSQFLETQSLNYKQISAPVLSIVGTDDTVVPAWNHHERLIGQLEQIQPLSLKGAGHAPHHTRPQIVAGAIRQFVSSLPEPL